jgi:hypothetical protein
MIGAVLMVDWRSILCDNKRASYSIADFVLNNTETTRFAQFRLCADSALSVYPLAVGSSGFAGRAFSV